MKIQIEDERDGPFWLFRDGLEMLKPYGFGSCEKKRDVLCAGLSVHFYSDHFIGLQICSNGVANMSDELAPTHHA